MNKTAIIYARVSSTTDRQNTDRQVMDLTKYAETHGYSVYNTFSEKISGAKKNSERIVLQDAIQYAISNQVEAILVSELSRLGRSVYEVQESIKICRDNNINVVFQKENVSIFDANGKESIVFPVLISCLGMAASIERENIAYRLQSGKLAKRQRNIEAGLKPTVGEGRPTGSVESDEAFLTKYKDAVKDLKKGIAIRKVAQLYSLSTHTVQKIKNVMKKREKSKSQILIPPF